jgi:cation diffusion facilitator CzcD-associated flavoprotein CzcO
MTHFHPAADDPGPRSLAELEARLRRDLEMLTLPPSKEWLEPRADAQGRDMLDVAIIGAGMAGLAAAFALKCLGVRNLRLFDRAPEGFEGPWLTYARMETLRSPKELTGPALGFANLTFRAWFEAQFGRAAWDRLHRIPRVQWMDYLRWYRKMVAVPIENGTELVDLGGDAQSVLLTLRSASGTRQVTARRVILATGRDGMGGAYRPALFQALDPRYCAHSSDTIDFAALRGKTVAVIGAGASAVDNAACALEAGASRVAMLIRRDDVPRINKGMGIGSLGLAHGFVRLTAAQRYAIGQYIADQAIPPPHDSMLRCSRHPNFSVIARCRPRQAAIKDGRLLLDTSRGLLAFDFLVLATGFTVDWSKRQELASLRPHIVLWKDRFTPEGRDEYAHGEAPFLGPDFEFCARDATAAPWVGRVHCFTFPAYMSHGPLSGDIPAISVGAERIAQGIAAALFAEDYERTWRRLLAWSNPELDGSEYTLDENVEAFAVDAAMSGAGHE